MPWLTICSTAPGDRFAGERESTEDDKAHVRERGVGDEPLQVPLHRSDDPAVDDADNPESQQIGAITTTAWGKSSRSKRTIP